MTREAGIKELESNAFQVEPRLEKERSTEYWLLYARTYKIKSYIIDSNLWRKQIEILTYCLDDRRLFHPAAFRKLSFTRFIWLFVTHINKQVQCWFCFNFTSNGDIVCRKQKYIIGFTPIPEESQMSTSKHVQKTLVWNHMSMLVFSLKRRNPYDAFPILYIRLEYNCFMVYFIERIEIKLFSGVFLEGRVK